MSLKWKNDESLWKQNGKMHLQQTRAPVSWFKVRYLCHNGLSTPFLHFMSFFLLEPLTPFQEHYDRLFADVRNRKIENILNCNFNFAMLGQGNWAGLLRVIYQTCANNTKCCWLLDAGVGNVLPNTGGSKLESVICSFAFVHFSLLPVFNSNVCLGAALLASLSLPWTRH